MQGIARGLGCGLHQHLMREQMVAGCCSAQIRPGCQIGILLKCEQSKRELHRSLIQLSNLIQYSIPVQTPRKVSADIPRLSQLAQRLRSALAPAAC